MARQRHRQAQATLVLSVLEDLALQDLARETERLRSALARTAPAPKGSKDDATENGELGRARMAATDALELWSRVHAACTLARLEASAGRREAEQAQGEEEDGDGEHHHAEQRQKDRKHWEHEG